MIGKYTLGAAIIAISVVAIPLEKAMAQDKYAAGSMWGTATVTNSLDSSQSHYFDGLSAGSVNAAKDGILYGDGSILSITSIGSQNVVSNTVINSNNVNIDNKADQTSNNSGDVTTDGTFHYTPTTVQNTGNSND